MDVIEIILVYQKTLQQQALMYFPCSENRRDFCDLQQYRRKIVINRIFEENHRLNQILLWYRRKERLSVNRQIIRLINRN
jgi:hypothetical protein